MLLGRLAGGRGNVLRTLVLSGLLAFAGAVVSGCAAQKLAVAPADHYGPTAEVQITSVEEELLERLEEGMAKAGLEAKLVPDPGLMMAARKIANRSIGAGGSSGGGARGPATGAAALASVGTATTTGPKKKVNDAVPVRELLLESGVADNSFQYRTVSRGYTAGPPSVEEAAEFFRGLNATGGELKVGVARIDDGLNSARHYTVVLSQRFVSFDALARQVEPGSQLALRGRFHEAVEQPTLWIQFADGKLESRALAPAADGSFSESIALPSSTGQMVLEISGRSGGGHRVLATAPVGVGEAPAQWPGTEVEARIRNALELEKAIDGLIANARGSAFSGQARVLENAKACASALAKGEACAPQLDGWHHVIVQEVVNVASAADWTAELAALPSVRSVLADPQVEHLGIAASPIEGRKGHYAVAVVFAGKGGPEPRAATAPAAAPAPEAIEPQPAAEPASVSPAAEPDAPTPAAQPAGEASAVTAE